MECNYVKKPRILSLHGHGHNAAILEEQVQEWPESVLEKMDLVFIDAPFPIEGKSASFVWFTFNQEMTECDRFDECVAYIEDCIVKHGPFDGLLGFSEGAFVAASVPGMQAHGAALTEVSKIKFVLLISGGKFGAVGKYGGSKYPIPKLAETAFSSPIEIPSLHAFGENDVAKLNSLELLESFVDPFVIYHHGIHEIPKLDEEGLKVMFSFLEKIQTVV